MPLLNKTGELIDTSSISDGAVDAGGLNVVPLDNWRADSRDGLALEVDDEPQAEFASAPLITINFPSFTDGRGLSLAVLLRNRVNFQGELRAVGDVHPDLLHYLRRCGFDSFALPEDRQLPAADNRGPLAPYTDFYQASVIEPEPAYRRSARGS